MTKRARIWQVLAVTTLTCHGAVAAPTWECLFNGKDKTGWKLRHSGQDSWTVEHGCLVNAGHGIDLLTEQKFGDCQLHIEFMLPSHSNSGVYLQGRYEVQVLSKEHKKPGKGSCGAIYSKVAPAKNVAKENGEWQTFDIKFLAARLGPEGKKTRNARITVVFNGEKVVDDFEIDGPTGGELDRKEGTPGPLLLQGNHGVVEYRNIWIRPLTEEEAARPGMLPLPPALAKTK